jgi:hypothetical protein
VSDFLLGFKWLGDYPLLCGMIEACYNENKMTGQIPCNFKRQEIIDKIRLILRDKIEKTNYKS